MSVFISIGSNIGDKEENCKKSISYLNNFDEITSVKTSHLYKTSPVDYTDQDWFVNCAVEIETSFSPDELLLAIHSIEKKMGRKRDVRFGPRTIDLDIILFNDLITDSDNLTIPHPRMHERYFVLQPLCDLNESFEHPVLKKSIKCLKDGLNSSEQEIDRI